MSLMICILNNTQKETTNIQNKLDYKNYWNIVDLNVALLFYK